jgi:hypothetical protein
MFGGYILVREDSGNTQLDPVELTEQGCPDIGHEVEWEDRMYRVYRVSHKPDPGARSDDSNHMTAHVFARAIGWSPRLGESTSPILPFTQPLRRSDGSFESAILPPTLLSILVLAGYDTAKIQFRTANREYARVVRNQGGTWTLVREAWRLSRVAKRHRNEVVAFIVMLESSETSSPVPAPSPPNSSHSPAPSPRRARPALSLVPAESDL